MESLKVMENLTQITSTIKMRYFYNLMPIYINLPGILCEYDELFISLASLQSLIIRRQLQEMVTDNNSYKV